MNQLLFYGQTLLSVSLLACLYVAEYRGGRVNLKSAAFRMRLTAIVLLLVLSGIDICQGVQKAGMCSPAVNLQAAAFVLLLSPHSYVDGKRQLKLASGFSVIAVLICAALLIMGETVWKTVIFSLLAVGGLLVDNVLGVREKYGDTDILFRSRAVWHSIEDYAGHSYARLLLSSVCLCLTAFFFSGIFSAVTLALSFLTAWLAVYVAYRKSSDSTVVYLSRSQLEAIEKGKKTQNTDKQRKPAIKMSSMIARIQKYMEEERPYLVEGFCITDLADAMYSNKVYVSKTINALTGNNFRYYVNSYRIAYAKKLWVENPDIKMKTLAFSCGFHTVVSFIQAFKACTDKTPFEWWNTRKLEALHGDRPVRKKAA